MPENFHARYEGSPDERRRAAQEPPPGVRRLARELPAATVEVDEVTGAVTGVTSQDPAARLTDPAATAEDAVSTLVHERGDLWGFSAEDAGTVEVRAVSRAGLPVVRLVQKVGGVEVFDSEVTAALSPDNAVVAISGQFFPGSREASSRRSAAPGAERRDGDRARGLGVDRRELRRRGLRALDRCP